MTPHLYGKLLHILNGRSVTPTEAEIRLVDLTDGLGPRIAQWAPRLGAQPTEAEIDAVTDAQALAALKLQQSDAEATRYIVRAMLLFYLRDKLARNPTPAERQTAMADFRQAWQDVT